MGKDRDAQYRSRISGYYRELMEQCQVHMDLMDKELPKAREDFG
jgi:hypothetical protein